MKKSALLLLLCAFTANVQAQILDSLRLGSSQVTYEIIAPSKFEDFGATVYGDQLLFVSSRGTSLFSKKYDYNNQKFFELYLYDFESGDVARYGDKLASLEKSKFHSGPSTLLPDSSGIVLSRNYKVPNLEDEVNFYLVYENWETGEHYTLPYCTRAYSFQHPFYDPATRRLFFAANLAGGVGGYDIYYSEFLKDGSWGDPVIVPGVNGPRDDVFPIIGSDGKLYFSRTESQMGLDVFVFDMETSELGAFKAPFRTSRDEFSLIQLNKDSAVFSQSQKGRFNTDLVLAYVETDGLEEPIQQFAVIVAVAEDQDPWAYAEELKAKELPGEIWVGEQDGKPVIMIRGNGPESEAVAVRDEVKSKGVPAVLTKDPVRPMEREEDVDTYAVIVPVGEDQDPWAYAEELKAKGVTGEIWVGEQDGEPVIMIRGKGPQSEAVAVRDEVKSKGVPAVLTKDPVRPMERIEEGVMYYSTIVGVFESPQGALRHQSEEIANWTSESFISLYKGRYYVVSADYAPESKAMIYKKEAVSNGIIGAWLLPEKLDPILLPNLSGSPDLIVYFRFDKYDVMDKYQKQIDDVMAQLPEGVERVYMVGHTDSRGTNAYNDQLSKNRVNEVAAYINGKYPEFDAVKELDSRGENELTNNCGDGVECDAYAHFLNRRVEVWFY